MFAVVIISFFIFAASKSESSCLKTKIRRSQFFDRAENIFLEVQFMVQR